MTFGMGILIGVLSTISVLSLGVFITAMVVNARKNRLMKMVPKQFHDYDPPLG